MTSIVNRFNTLSGIKNRTELRAIVNEARAEGVYEIVDRIRDVLKLHPKKTEFKITVQDPIYAAEKSLLCGLEGIEEVDDYGLGKAVSADEIYQMITDMVIDLIESGKDLPWRKPWGSVEKYGMLATNFESKKAYRGINALLLNQIIPAINQKEFDIPYFLTFKQIEKRKGKLKKGSSGYKVVYFTTVYSYFQNLNDLPKLDYRTTDLKKFIRWANTNKNKISFFVDGGTDMETFVRSHTIPMLKYYNVFNADDIEGIDWKIKELRPKTEIEKIETAEAIVNSYPSPPKIVTGKEAFYTPSKDQVTMPPAESFDEIQHYHGVLFHELIHSTGSKNRLNREKGKKFGDTKYAFEELIAELGASFLNAESGILFSTINNSAAYLKGWRSGIVKGLKKDNRGFFRAASKAQAAADHILDRDKEGVPAYIRNLPELLTVKEESKIDSNDNKNISADFSDPKTFESDWDFEKLKQSYYWISFSPEKRAKNEIEDWGKYLSDTYLKLSVLAKENEFKSLDSEFSKYYSKLKKMKANIISHRSSLASSAITGGSKFPVAKQRKLQDRHHDLEGDYYKYMDSGVQKIKSAIYGSTRIKSGDKNALELLENRLENLILLKEIQGDFNKNYKSDKSTKEEKEIFFERYNFKDLFKKSYAEKSSFLVPSAIKRAMQGEKLVLDLYLSKNILDLKKRITAEKNRNKVIDNLNNKYVFDDVEIILNEDQNRVQLLYDGKPEQNTIKKLKANGFRWSPKNKVWQRQLNFNGLNAAKRVTGHDFPINNEKKKSSSPKLNKPSVQPARKSEHKKSVEADQKESEKQLSLFGTREIKQIKSLGFVQASENFEPPADVFELKGEIGKFLQKIQPHQELILIKGTKHTSKSQLAMQIANALSEYGMCVGYIDEEQGGLESKDTYDSLMRNTTEEGRKGIFVKGSIENPMRELEDICKFCGAIVADSVTDLKLTADQLNELRKKYSKVIWVFISQVKENGEMYGGNKMAHNPTKIIQCHTSPNPEYRYATWEKNRGNNTELMYSIFHKKIITEKPGKEEPKVENKPDKC
jgi:antirestriction protein ArdC